jgi:hypothetical protein
MSYGLISRRLIFGSHFPFRVAQLRGARARGAQMHCIDSP